MPLTSLFVWVAQSQSFTPKKTPATISSMSFKHPEGEPAITRPEEISQLEDEIEERWRRLPPEHQATMLLDLLEISPEGDWSTQLHHLQEKPMTLLEKELAVNPRYSESYGDDEMRVDIITDETIPEVNIGIEPGTEAGLLAFLKEKVVTSEPVYACVEGGEGVFPQLVDIDWSQPMRLAWKKKEGAIGRVFRARIPPGKINSLTFLQRREGGLTVIFYWPQIFFDEGIERVQRLPASEIAMLEFFFSHPHYMKGKEGFPNGVLVQWAREHGGDSRVRPPGTEAAITVFK